MMHVYLPNGNQWDVMLAYTVGNNLKTQLVETFNTKLQASAWVSYLNGGNYPPTGMDTHA
jgi:hypothetical protein